MSRHENGHRGGPLLRLRNAAPDAHRCLYPRAPQARRARDRASWRNRRGRSVVIGVDVMEQFDRITQIPDVMGGKACIRGMRITVGMIVGMIGAGHSIDNVLEDYTYLEREDVFQALRYAAWLAEEREIVLPSG